MLNEYTNRMIGTTAGGSCDPKTIQAVEIISNKTDSAAANDLRLITSNEVVKAFGIPRGYLDFNRALD